MPYDSVFDDGEAEAGAPQLAGAPFVDAVEAFEESGEMLGRDAGAVVGDCHGEVFAVLLAIEFDSVASRVGEGVGDEVAEYGDQQRAVAGEGAVIGDGVTDSDTLLPGLGYESFDDLRYGVAQVDGLRRDAITPLFDAGKRGDILKQGLEAFVGFPASRDKLVTLRVGHILVGHQGLQTYLEGRDRGLQLVVYVVSELTFDSYLLLLFMEGGAMFPVAVHVGLLETGVQAYYVVGDLAELVVGKRLCIDNPLPLLDLFSKEAEPLDVSADAPHGEVTYQAHYKGDDGHKPQESVVGGKQLVERHVVGHGSADDIPRTLAGRIEVCHARALAVASDRVSLAMSDGVGYLHAVQMVGAGKRVERIVVDDSAYRVYDANSDPFEIGREAEQVGMGIDIGGVFGEVVKKALVYSLELQVELSGLETFLAIVLKDSEAADEHYRVGHQSEEETAVVCKPIP